VARLAAQGSPSAADAESMFISTFGAAGVVSALGFGIALLSLIGGS
jgi:hypothetical protein